MSHVNRLNRRQWAAARFAALERDGWACVQCGKKGRLEVDHIKGLEQGGQPFTLGNLQTLCSEHHWIKTWGDRSTLEQRRWRNVLKEIDGNGSS